MSLNCMLVSERHTPAALFVVGGCGRWCLRKRRGQLVEAVGELGGVAEEGDRKGGGAGADIEVVARAEVEKIVLESIRSRRQSH